MEKIEIINYIKAPAQQLARTHRLLSLVQLQLVDVFIPIERVL